jgi:poly(A) polymerase
LEDGILILLEMLKKEFKEDYLRILRYLRFYLNYSKQKHQLRNNKIIKKNIDGISNYLQKDY